MRTLEPALSDQEAGEHPFFVNEWPMSYVQNVNHSPNHEEIGNLHNRSKQYMYVYVDTSLRLRCLGLSWMLLYEPMCVCCFFHRGCLFEVPQFQVTMPASNGRPYVRSPRSCAMQQLHSILISWQNAFKMFAIVRYGWMCNRPF